MKVKLGKFGVAVCAIILNKENDVLITLRSKERDHHPGEWEVMTGRLNKNESLEEALHREAKEELGINLDIVSPINTFHFYRGEEKIEHVGVTFLCKHKSGEVKVDGIEEVDYKWVPLDEAIDIVKDESIKKDFQLAKKYIYKKSSV